MAARSKASKGEDGHALRVAVIGAGHGGVALLEMLADDPVLSIEVVADARRGAPGIARARKLGIATTTDFEKVIVRKDIDAIIDVTGNMDVRRRIQQAKRPEVELIGGMSAKLMWDLVEERRRSEEEAKQLVTEHKSLYQVGLLLSSSESPHEVFETIVDQATALTNSPAGSLAVFDEGSGEMYLGAAKGFSASFAKEMRWTLRGRGLTSYILNQKEPVIISDVAKYKGFDNPVMIKEGVKSLVAVPLAAEGRIVGIIYVDDFKPRTYTAREVSILTLLSNYAAFAIERATLLEETRLRSITDDLTKLYNHRHFIQMLNQEVERSARYGRPVALAMIDIHFFKVYNDTYGHLDGNVVLKEVARTLMLRSRQVDVVARYGGEEFAVIMPETDKANAVSMAQRLRALTEKHHFPKEQSQPGGHLTISVGVACHPDDADSPVDLIARADEALYEAKSAGRNKVCVA